MFVRPAAAHYGLSIQKTETVECVRSKYVTAVHEKQSTTVTVSYVRREKFPQWPIFLRSSQTLRSTSFFLGHIPSYRDR